MDGAWEWEDGFGRLFVQAWVQEALKRNRVFRGEGGKMIRDCGGS